MNRSYAQVLILVILVGTATLDVATPLGVAVWVGHVFAVLMTLWVDLVIAPYIVAAIGSILLQVGYTLSAPSIITTEWAVFNRFMGFALLWVTAWLVVRAKQSKLDDATRRLGAIVESSSDAILSLAPDGHITSWNTGAERMFGYTAAEMMGRSAQILIPELEHEKAQWQASLHGKQNVDTYDAVRIAKNGRSIHVSVTLSPLRDAAGRFMGMSKIMRDISERKRAQTFLQQAHEALEIKIQERTFELSNANRSLRELSNRLMQVQEEERSRLARDLHDEVGQLLTALKIDLQEVQHGEVTQVRSDSLTDSLVLVDRLLTQVRTLALDLRPSMLDDLGLVPALRWYANRQAERNGWILAFSSEGVTERIPAIIEVACFRVVQEALTNVSKYAKANTIDLTLYRQGQAVVLVIQDDGVGFDVGLARRRAQGGQTLGLLGMEERVRLAGGVLEISSAPGHGTRLELCFTLTEQNQGRQPATVEVMAP